MSARAVYQASLLYRRWNQGASRPALVAGAAHLQVVADAEREQAGIWQSTQDSTGHVRRAAMIH